MSGMGLVNILLENGGLVDDEGIRLVLGQP